MPSRQQLDLQQFDDPGESTRHIVPSAAHRGSCEPRQSGFRPPLKMPHVGAGPGCSFNPWPRVSVTQIENSLHWSSAPVVASISSRSSSMHHQLARPGHRQSPLSRHHKPPFKKDRATHAPKASSNSRALRLRFAASGESTASPARGFGLDRADSPRRDINAGGSALPTANAGVGQAVNQF